MAGSKGKAASLPCPCSVHGMSLETLMRMISVAVVVPIDLEEIVK